MPAGLPPCCRLPGASTGGPSEKRKQNKGKITQGVSDFLSDSSVEETPFGLLGPDTEGVPLKLSLPGLVRTQFVPAPCELGARRYRRAGDAWVGPPHLHTPTPGVLRLLVPTCLSASMCFSEVQKLLPVCFRGCSCV